MNWEKKKILLVVKAYPESSKKHGSVVCTAGVTDDGELIRIYPIPFENFRGKSRIPKYTWIEAEVKKATDEKLKRKESYKVRQDSIKIIDESGFDIQSLTPKQLEITLSLRENRTGNQSGFEAGAIGSGDNVVGWEAIIDKNNMDPYNGLVNPDKDYLAYRGDK